MLPSLIALCALVTTTGCSEDDQGLTFRFSSVRVPLLKPPVDAKTPVGLKQATPGTPLRAALSPTATAEACPSSDFPGQDPDDPTSDIAKCRALDTVKSRFFGNGPTTLNTILDSIDGRIANYFGDPSRYFPCLDSENIDGVTIGEDTFAPFGEVVGTLAGTFTDGSSFDPGVAYTLNCLADIDSDAWVAVGRTNDVTVVYEGSPRGPSKLALIDANRTIDMWYVVHQVNPTFDAVNGPERLGPATVADTVALTYLGSTGLIHVRADAGTHRLELTATGEGLGDGCGMHLQTNGDVLYYRANRNFYGRCYPNDYTDHGALKYNDSGQPLADQDSADVQYRTGFDNLEYCYDVSTNTPTPTTLASCTAQGVGIQEVLDSNDPSGGTTTTASTFELIPVKRYNPDNTTDHTIMGYNSAQLLNTKPTNLAALREAFFPPDSTLEIEDAAEADAPAGSTPDLSTLVENELFLVRNRSLTVNPWSAGFCRDQGTDVEAFNLVYDIDLSTLSASVQTTLSASPLVAIKLNIDNALGPLGNALGWSRFTGATLSLNADNAPINGVTDRTVDSENVDETPSADGIQAVVVPLPEDFDASTTTSLRVTLTGSQRYACSAGAANLQAISTRPSLGDVRLVYFAAP